MLTIVGNGNTEDLIEYYIHGEPEPIVSKITEDKSLRTHILSVIVTHPGIKKEELVELIYDHLFVTFGKKILEKVKGYVST